MNDQATDQKLKSAMATHDEGLAKMQSIRADFRSYAARLDTVTKSVHAALAEAQTADTQWRARLHESEGEITRDIQSLRKQARDSRDLADEYGSIREEMEHELDVKRLELATAAKGYILAHRHAMDALMAAKIEEIAADAGPAIRQALALFHKTLVRNNHAPDWTDDPRVITDRFYHRLAVAIGPCDEPAGDLPLPPLDLAGVDIQLAQSPARQGALRQRIQKSKA